MARVEDRPRSLVELEQLLSLPSAAVVEELARLEGNLVVLGAGGKIGPTLARMARRALDESGNDSEVLAVSRFSRPGLQDELESGGVRTLASDLTEPGAVERLPDAAAVLFLAGKKFGTSASPASTWAINAWTPGLVARRYGGVPTVVFSSGNVYPMIDVEEPGGGSTEESVPAPLGEYAASVLARECVFEHFARLFGTPTLLLRLSYAVELRYGVLVDVARRVLAGEPIDLRVGYVNVLWQGDANAMALRCLGLARRPVRVLNVTGLERVSIRDLATRFGERFERRPKFSGDEGATALLSDAALAHRLLGPPAVPLERLVEWTAEWVAGDGDTWGLPTHYEVADGTF